MTYYFQVVLHLLVSFNFTWILKGKKAEHKYCTILFDLKNYMRSGTCQTGTNILNIANYRHTYYSSQCNDKVFHFNKTKLRIVKQLF